MYLWHNALDACVYEYIHVCVYIYMHIDLYRCCLIHRYTHNHYRNTYIYIMECLNMLSLSFWHVSFIDKTARRFLCARDSHPSLRWSQVSIPYSNPKKDRRVTCHRVLLFSFLRLSWFSNASLQQLICPFWDHYVS